MASELSSATMSVSSGLRQVYSVCLSLFHVGISGVIGPPTTSSFGTPGVHHGCPAGRVPCSPGWHQGRAPTLCWCDTRAVAVTCLCLLRTLPNRLNVISPFSSSRATALHWYALRVPYRTTIHDSWSLGSETSNTPITPAFPRFSRGGASSKFQFVFFLG